MANLIIKSNLKQVIKDLRVSADLAEALNKKLERILKEAVERAKANKRTTVMAQDL